MLETTFERIPGDIGHPASHPGPVLHRVVRGASVARVIGAQDSGLVDLFAAEAESLVAAGATAITTSCGFMARHHGALAARVAVPFAASALCLLPDLRREFGPVAVITADAAGLGVEHFAACGAPVPEVVAGMDHQPAFRSAIVAQTESLRPDEVRAEVVAVAAEVRASHPEVRALLLECTNLPPYRAAVEGATGLPTFDALTLCRRLMDGSLATLSG